MEYVAGVEFIHFQDCFIAVPHTAGSVVKAAAYEVPRLGVHQRGGIREPLPRAGALPPAQQRGQPWHPSAGSGSGLVLGAVTQLQLGPAVKLP